MKISIVTITRNCLADLQKTSASILGQTYPHYEWIVVDALSTDGTADFLKTLGPNHSWVSEKDNGISDAFNKGMRMATADTLVFLNSGDTFSAPDTLEEFVRQIPANTAIADSVIYGNFLTVSNYETFLMRADHLDLDRTNTINHQSAFIGKHIYQRFTYDERLFLGMDYDFWLRCRSQNVPFIKVDIPIARFDLNGRSSSLDFQIHNQLMRYLLRAINSKRILSLSDAFAFLGIALRTWLQVTVRRLIPKKLWLFVKSIFGSQSKAIIEKQ